MCEASDDDVPQLSNEALLALEEFYQERAARERLAQEVDESGKCSNNVLFEENWQLSQFWYSDDTIDVLSKEVCRLAGEHGRIALISCPSLYHSVKKYAAQSEAYGEDFHFYDYNTPLEIPEKWAHSCDVVIADPPFLSTECLTKTALTVRILAKDKIILCTGAVMADLAERLLGISKCDFQPLHKNNLANDFLCFTNYNGFSKS